MDGVMLQVDHLHQADAGGKGQVVDGEQEAEQGQGLGRGAGELAGAGGFLMLFQHGLLLGKLLTKNRRQLLDSYRL